LHFDSGYIFVQFFVIFLDKNSYARVHLYDSLSYSVVVDCNNTYNLFICLGKMAVSVSNIHTHTHKDKSVI